VNTTVILSEAKDLADAGLAVAAVFDTREQGIAAARSFASLRMTGWE
jgi:hypothetical protein